MLVWDVFDCKLELLYHVRRREVCRSKLILLFHLRGGNFQHRGVLKLHRLCCGVRCTPRVRFLHRVRRRELFSESVYLRPVRPWVLLQLNCVHVVHSLPCWYDFRIRGEHLLYRMPDRPFFARRFDQLLELCGEWDVRCELQCVVVCALPSGHVSHRGRSDVLVLKLPRWVCSFFSWLRSLCQLPGWGQLC